MGVIPAVTPAPEPSTLAIFGAAFICVAAFRDRLGR